MVTGLILAATGVAPEHWFAELVHEAHLPADILHLWSAGIDPRLVLMVLGVTMIAGDIVWRRVRPRTLPTAPPPDTGALPLPDRPSIAVLAFDNLSGDPEQEYFSDGVADDIITELSRNRSLFVIARNSGFTYKGHAVDVKRVGRELGVRYVVEGSVRRDGTRIRIAAQLIDAETGNHIWAERYDRDLADLFTVQDEITRAMVVAIDPAISHAERERAMRKSPDTLSAWEAWQRALWHWSKDGDFSTARDFLQRAVALDPRFAPPHAMLAWLYTSRATLGVGLPLGESVRLAEIEARTAIELDPGSVLAHSMLAWVFDHQGDQGTALEEAEIAIALNANDPHGHLIMGRVLILSGRPGEGREPLATALRFDPRGPTAPSMMHHRTMGCYFEGDYLGAEAMARRAIRAYPQFSRSYLWLAAALGQLGRAVEALGALDSAIAASPGYFKFNTGSRPPYFRPADYEHLLDGLRKAGWEG
jgi:adenylate cyclase